MGKNIRSFTCCIMENRYRVIHFSPYLHIHVAHPVNKVYMAGENLRLSVNCLYGYVIENLQIVCDKFLSSVPDDS